MRKPEELGKQPKKTDKALKHDTGRPDQQDDNSCNTFRVTYKLPWCALNKTSIPILTSSLILVS